MFVWYLRNTYLENRLRNPGDLTGRAARGGFIADRRADVLYGLREDHIVPWTAAYIAPC